MSLRSIEMQIALPRTTEAGIMQSQLSQRPVQEQALLANESHRKAELQRQRSQQVDETPELHVRDDGSSNRGDRRHLSKTSKKDNGRHNEDASGCEHPYKGHHVDLTF